MNKSLKMMIISVAIIAIICSLLGLFYSTGGKQFVVNNIYGQQIELYGNGIYKNDSLLKVGSTRGTDIAIIFVATFLLIISIYKKNSNKYKLIQGGLLVSILYNTSCLIFGVTFNKLFLIYLPLFSLSLFSLILLLNNIFKSDIYQNAIYNKKLSGISAFIILSGCSVLQWLFFIIPAIITNKPLENIDIYTTEPTFILDLAIVLPISIWCSISLLKQKIIAYKFAPIFLTFISVVGLCVIGQTIIQMRMGLVLSLAQAIFLVGIFIILGLISLFLNKKILKYTK